MVKPVRKGIQFTIVLSVMIILTNTVFSQSILDQKINLSVDDQLTTEVLSEVAKKGHFSFAYNSNYFKGSSTSSLHLSNTPIRKTLQLLLGNEYNYKVRGSYVIIQKKQVEKPKKQVYSVKGKIVDKTSGQQIQGARVYEVNSLSSNSSNEDGQYALEVKSKSNYINLAISAQNYKDTIVQVAHAEGRPLEVVLIPELQDLRPVHPLDSNGWVKFFAGDDHDDLYDQVYLEEKRPFQLSLLPKIGTNGRMSGLVSNTVSVNLVSGYSNNVNAFEMGGVLNIVRNNVKGFQIGGVGNMVGAKVSGTQLAGVFNLNTQSVKGVQIGGVCNISKDSLMGVQLSGVSNLSKNLARGLQMGGVSNHSSRFSGFQVAGVVNTTEELKGAQIAGVFNQAKAVKGVQFSGVLNKANKVKGFQIGLINIADTIQSGAAIGLFSFVKNGFRKLALESNDVTHANLTYKMGTQHFYNIYTAGYRFDDFPLASFGLGFGSYFKLSEKLFSDLELSSNNLFPVNDSWDQFSALSKLKLGIGYQIKEHLSISGALTANWLVSDYQNPDTGELGFNIGNNSFYSETTASRISKMWLGYSVSIQF